jgi:hypothetical protein
LFVGRSGRTFVLFELVGGERVGYLRAVFAGESLDAVFAAEAALELEEPIVRVCVPQLIKGGIGRNCSWDWELNWVSGEDMNGEWW